LNAGDCDHSGQCWLCGTPIPRRNIALANHGWDPNRRIAWKKTQPFTFEEKQDKGNVHIIDLLLHFQ
jgi:hypothetical protein